MCASKKTSPGRSYSVRRLLVAAVSVFILVPYLTLKCLHFTLQLIAIPCERCDVERRDFGFGDEDVFAAETRLQVRQAYAMYKLNCEI